MRRRSWPYELALVVRDLRRTFPAWGRDELGPILHSQGYRVSLSTVGRILA